MKINDLLETFTIFVTNEEKKILDKMDEMREIGCYSERERFIIENLIRKSLVSKVRYQETYMVRRND